LNLTYFVCASFNLTHTQKYVLLYPGGVKNLVVRGREEKNPISLRHIYPLSSERLSKNGHHKLRIRILKLAKSSF